MVEVRELLPVLDISLDSVSDHLSLGLITQMVLIANPHGNGNLVNAVKRDLLGLVSNLIVLLELLEALLDRALSVVKGRLDGRGLSDNPSRCILAVQGHLGANFFEVLELVKTSLMIDTHRFILELAPLPKLGVAVLILSEPNARGESSKLEDRISVELFLQR